MFHAHLIRVLSMGARVRRQRAQPSVDKLMRTPPILQLHTSPRQIALGCLAFTAYKTLSVPSLPTHCILHHAFREQQIRGRLHCRLEPGVRKPGVRRSGEVLVHVHAGATAGVTRVLRGLSERPDAALDRRCSNTSQLVVSAAGPAEPPKLKGEQHGEPRPSGARSPFDMEASDGISSRICCMGALDVVGALAPRRLCVYS